MAIKPNKTNAHGNFAPLSLHKIPVIGDDSVLKIHGHPQYYEANFLGLELIKDTPSIVADYTNNSSH